MAVLLALTMALGSTLAAIFRGSATVLSTPTESAPPDVPQGCRAAGDGSDECGHGFAEVIDPFGDRDSPETIGDPEAEASCQEQGNDGRGGEPPVHSFAGEQHGRGVSRWNREKR